MKCTYIGRNFWYNVFVGVCADIKKWENNEREANSMYHSFMKRAKAVLLSTAVLAGALSVPAATSMSASAADTDNYAKLLQYTMYFYDANMCGSQVSENTALNWRGDCHTGDEVNGGFHDAGDHAMFGLPQGYTAATLGWGYYEFKDSYDTLGLTSHLKTITDYFCQFFKDSTVLSGGSVSKFLYQKGDGDVDHNYWGKPENQESQAGVRKMYWTTNSASDIAAEYAAALAVNYINFGNEEDLTYAKALYEFSTKNNSIATDGPASFYGSEDYKDDQAWAAGFLYIATKDSQYKSFMDTYFATDNRQWGEVYYTHCWNNVNLGAACLYAEIGADWKWANSYVSKNCTGSAFVPIQQWGSARLNTGLQLAAMVVSKHTSNDYTTWCKGQTAMLLGDNSIGKNMIVGFNSDSPKNPHHRAASGYDSYDEMNKSTTVHPSKSHTLVGALVGGPTSSDFSTYEDSLQNYTTNEVACDYNAAIVGLAAALYEQYGTGSLDSTIEGVGSVNTNPVTTQPGTSTTTSSTTTSTSTTIESGTNTEEVELSIAKNEKKWIITNQGASEITVKITGGVTGAQINGGYGYWDNAKGEWMSGNWTAADFDSTGSSSFTLTVPAAAATVELEVYYYAKWDNAVSDMVVQDQDQLDFKAYAEVSTSTSTSSTTTTTTTSTVIDTTTTTTDSQKVEATKLGDVNCDGNVKINDVILLNRFLAEDDDAVISDVGLVNADFTADGDVDASDAVAILKLLAGL